MHVFLFALVLFLFSFPASAHAITKMSTGRIYGQLLDGTKRNAPVAGQRVTLQMAQGDNARDLATVTTDSHGMFSFSSLDTDKTINYAVYTLYQGAQYYTDLIGLSKNPVQQINLTVYDATTSIANIAIVQANVLVDKVDAQNDLITISENFFFENLGLTTYVGSLKANDSKPNALRFSLPNNARKLSLSSGFNGYQVIQVNSGFATDAALPPGTSQFAFSFQVPYTTSSYDFSYTAVYPTVDLSLLAPLNIHASSSGMDSLGPVNANQHTYQQFKSQKLLTGDQIHVQLGGLPAPQAAATTSTSPLNQNTLWFIVALLLMLAIVSVTWFVYRLSRRQRRARQQQLPRRGGSGADVGRGPLGRPSSKNQQETLLQELLDLDAAYEAGKIKDVEYQERRAKTKARLRSVMSTDLVKKTARSSGKRSS
jgi:5-hydroxyisourate hydrolase-like protein (transthyretin family)